MFQIAELNDDNALLEELSRREWREDFLKYTFFPFQNAPLVYLEEEISSINPGLAVHGASDVGFPLSFRHKYAIVESCMTSAVHRVTLEGFEGIEDSAWHLPSAELKIQNPGWSIVVSLAVKKAVKGLRLHTEAQNIRADLRELLVLKEGQSAIFPPRLIHSTRCDQQLD